MAGVPVLTPVRADFHLHTWCSDGDCPPEALAAEVGRARLEWWAVTDHDTFAGWRRCAALGLPGLVPGVEVTASDGGREIHVVGLGTDPGHDGLGGLLARIRDLRRERMAALIARLPSAVRGGLDVDAVRDRRAGEAGESLSRNHLARALVERGAVARLRDAFGMWLGDEHLADGNLPSFPGVEEVAAAIRAAGGVAILAHPGCYRDADRALGLMRLGLDGLEVEHPNLDSAIAQRLRAEAAARGWLQSLGSDYHHPAGSRRPGCVALGAERLAPLLRRLARFTGAGAAAR